MSSKTDFQHGISEPEKSSGSYHLLLVDDEEITRNLSRRQLLHLGFSVDIAPSGATALEILKKHKFDLILLDCEMPGMCGFETAKSIRQYELSQNTAPVPIIALTGHSSADIRLLCIYDGMNDLITRPTELDLLEKSIRSWLEPKPVNS